MSALDVVTKLLDGELPKMLFPALVLKSKLRVLSPAETVIEPARERTCALNKYISTVEDGACAESSTPPPDVAVEAI